MEDNVGISIDALDGELSPDSVESFSSREILENKVETLQRKVSELQSEVDWYEAQMNGKHLHRQKLRYVIISCI